MLKFRCKNCDQKIGVPDDWRGHLVRCPRCKQGVDVPNNAQFVNKAPPPPRESKQKSAPSTPAPVAVAPLLEQAEPAPIPVEASNTVAEPAPVSVVAQEVQPTTKVPALAGPSPVHAATLTSPPTAIPIVAPMPVVSLHAVVAEAPLPVQIAATSSTPPAAPTDPVTFAPSAPITTEKLPKSPKKWPKKPKAEAKPAAKVAHPSPIPSAKAASATRSEPIPPIAPDDPSVVVVTVARRDEPFPSPQADPETGNVVNLAEVLTNSAVTPKPIVTSAPPSDFASVFSSGAEPSAIPPMIDAEPVPPTPVAVTVVEPVSAPVESEPIVTSVMVDVRAPFASSEARSEPFSESIGSDRALSEIIDVLPSEEQSPAKSSAATDLLDTLARTTRETNAADGPLDLRFDTLLMPEAPTRAPSRPKQKKSTSLAVATLAMLAAAASLGLCVTHSHARMSLPAGVSGLLLAVLATVLAQRRSVIAMITGIGAAVASTTGIVIGVLIGLGKLPGSAAYAREQLAMHLPAARAGDVEVRVRSAEVLHPVLIRQNKLGPTAETKKEQSVLRVEVELKNVSDHDAHYTSWASTAPTAEPVWLHDDEGNLLKPMIAVGAIPLGRVTDEVVRIKPKGGTIGDVLLFEAPPMQARELDLQLPGANVGSLEPLQLHIPAEMFARQ